MNLYPRWICGFAAVLALTGCLRAQQSATADAPGNREADLAITYTEQYSNLVSTSTFWHGGGGAELSAPIYRGFGMAANVAGTETSNAANSSVGLTLVTANFGPRYTFRHPLGLQRNRSVAIFGQALGGLAWGFNSYFPSSSGAQTNYVSFDLQLGGGVDLGLSRHFGLRLFQGDWVRTEFPNGTTNVQNNLRLAAGVVFRIPQRQ
jgi:outer membrane immunogenic protein